MTELKMLELGQILAFTRDEGVDFMLDRLVKVVKPFNLSAARDEWGNLHTEWRECNLLGKVTRVKKGGLEYIAYLIDKGLVEKVKCIEIHESYRGTVCYD